MVEQVLEITEDEAALYDRQIRLWGLDAQKRLRASKVLVAGLQGLGAEICKNIVLAGIKSLVLLDSNEVTLEDGAAQFFVTKEDLGKNRAECSLSDIQKLNPMVEVSADTEDVVKKPDDFFLKFDVVCLIGCSADTMMRVNEICRQGKIKFFAGEVNGFFGYMFADLGEHEFVVDVPQTLSKPDDKNGASLAKKAKLDNPDTNMERKKVTYVSLTKALNLDWMKATNRSLQRKLTDSYFIMKILQRFRTEHNRNPSLSSRNEDAVSLEAICDDVISDTGINKEKISENFAQFCFAELSPVCAITGGVLAQEIVKAVSHKDQAHNNFFFYNGLTGHGVVETIGE